MLKVAPDDTIEELKRESKKGEGGRGGRNQHFFFVLISVLIVAEKIENTPVSLQRLFFLGFFFFLVSFAILAIISFLLSIFSFLFLLNLGKELNDPRTLSSYEITADKVIHLFKKKVQQIEPTWL